MGRVHEVLHWANRRAVAEEVTRRGYRVSGETLNRWVRDEKEFPAVVERIVFDLFTIGQQEAPPPQWARALAEQTADDVVRRIVPDGLLEKLPAFLDRLEASLPPSGEAVPEGTESRGPVA